MAKRGNGEGSIYQRSDGRWVAQVSLETGKKKCIYGRTRADVSKKLPTALKAQQDNLPVPSDRLTVAKFLADWLVTAKPGLRPRAYDSYEQIVRVHLTPALGKKVLTRLTPGDLQMLLARKSEAGLSAVRVGYIRTVLRVALGCAVKWSLVSRNIAALTDAPRVDETEVIPFTPDEARTFIQAVRGDRLVALYTVALSIGLRQGEALGLRWQDIDLDDGLLNVRFALQRLKGKYEFVEPKTKRSRRSIPLPSFAITALREHRKRQLEERLRAGSEWDDRGLVFATERGRPLDGSNTTRRFQKLVAAAGLPRQRFHDMRHCAASLLLAQGVHPRVVMEILGHSRISLTMDRYTHVTKDLQRDAAGRMDDLFKAAN